VRIPERRDALYLVEEGAQLLDQRLLRSKLLALGGGPGVAQLARERLEAPLLVREFWSNMFHLHLIERIARKRMQLQPNGICTRWCCQLPECWSGSSMQRHLPKVKLEVVLSQKGTKFAGVRERPNSILKQYDRNIGLR